jgi:hypothetical protein
MSKNKYIRASTAVAIGIGVGAMVFFATARVSLALTSTIISSATSLQRIRVDYTDVQAAPDLVGDGSWKRLIVRTVPKAEYLLGVVTKTNIGFTGPNPVSPGKQIVVFADAVRIEDADGGQYSAGDFAMPPNLEHDDTLENRFGNGMEYGFYSEDTDLKLVYYIKGMDSETQQPIDLNTLSAGQFDVYYLITSGK